MVWSHRLWIIYMSQLKIDFIVFLWIIFREHIIHFHRWNHKVYLTHVSWATSYCVQKNNVGLIYKSTPNINNHINNFIKYHTNLISNHAHIFPLNHYHNIWVSSTHKCQLMNLFKNLKFIMWVFNFEICTYNKYKY
jgi:hypothetical protein